MKKYKTNWSLWNYGESVQKPIVALQNLNKNIMAMIGGCTWLLSNADYAILVGVIAYLADFGLSCIVLDETGL